MPADTAIHVETLNSDSSTRPYLYRGGRFAVPLSSLDPGSDAALARF